MGTEVLHPHDFLIGRIRGHPAMVYPRRRNACNNHYNKPIRSKPAPVRSDQKKKPSESSPAILRRYSSDDLRHSKQNHNHNHNSNQNNPLVRGQITILKRGEQLDRKRSDLIVSGAERLGPDAKTEIRSRSLSPKPVAGGLPDVYAGSAFSVSPAPESLPLPSFSKKKQVSVTVDDSATRDLRRLLRLD